MLICTTTDLSREQRRQHDRLRDVPEAFDDDDTSGGYEQDVLHGRTTADLSHAGEALTREDVARADGALYEQLMQSHRWVFSFHSFCCVPLSEAVAFRQLFGKYRDSRTRRDRTQRRVNAFNKQLEAMADAYMGWCLAVEEGGGLGSSCKPQVDDLVQETRDVLVVDIFCTFASEFFFNAHVNNLFISLSC